jgi:hypothetical protein
MINLFIIIIIAAVLAYVAMRWAGTRTPREDAPRERLRGFTYVRLRGRACAQVDIHGDTGLLFEKKTLLQVQRLEDGWMRYWYVDEQDCENIVEAMESIEK